MKKQKKQKISINSWVIVRTFLKNGMLKEVVEIGKVLDIEDHFGGLFDSIDKIKDKKGYQIKTASGVIKWVRVDRIEKIASPTALGIDKKGILNMQETLNKDIDKNF